MKIKNIFLLISSLRLIPHFVIFNFHSTQKLIKYDVKRWLDLTRNPIGIQIGFLYLMTFFPEFRNLFYHRLGKIISAPLNILCPKMNTLFLGCEDIGPGLFIQHGFATIIFAKSIGKDCWINQQVTIGFNGLEQPVIKDNVNVHAGAKVLGGVTIGTGSTIGANAVVVKDVPNNCVIVGVPGYIIKREGKKVKMDL